ncbi:MAG: hypothetical protein PHR35_04205 [Kiritimatiellae bacterium]|nr:hypothetical protein [Kiritimatiellia bacterium]
MNRIGKVAMPMLPSIPNTRQTGNTFGIANEYWTLAHDRRQGGCPTSLTFRHGTGRNLLVAPLGAHIAADRGKGIEFYRQHLDTKAALMVKQTPAGPEVSTSGRLRSETGATLPVRYRQTYRYEAWGMVKVRLTLTFERTIERIYELGVCDFFLRQSVDRIGYRAGLPPPPPAAGCYYETDNLLHWWEPPATGSYRQQYPVDQKFIPTWFCLFEKGVEGLEFWRSDAGAAWDQPFGIAPGQAVFLDDSRKFDDRRHVRLEPFCDWAQPRSFGPGTIAWDYTLGLPFVKERRVARQLAFHAGIASVEWPSGDTLKQWADAGISLVRLHDDDSRMQPSWRNCLYPPYDAGNMRTLDGVIKQCHRLGLKIVPYFSLKHFHWNCPEYAAKADEWKRWIHEDGRIEVDGPYGGYMCMKSGWLDFKMATIDLVLRRHAFDGIYYDHMWYRYCRHPGHGGGWHTDADEVLEFMRWTRERVGPDGTIFIHTSGCPGLVFENLSNLIFIGEDMPYARIMPGGHPPDLEFVPIAPRNWVPAGKRFAGEGPEARRSFFVALLEGCPTCALGETLTRIPAFILQQFALFKPYDLARFTFWRASEKPVDTGHPDVHAALLASRTEALIYCANLGDHRAKTTLQASARTLGWKAAPAAVSLAACTAALIPVPRLPSVKGAGGASRRS